MSDKKEYICKTCKKCMKIKEINDSSANKYRNCLYDREIDCTSVAECNMYESVK